MSEFVDLYDRNRKFLNRVVDRNTYLFQPGEFMMYVLAILENEEGKFLVTQRALDKKWAAGGWEMPGGGAKSKESSLDAIKREVKEETGLDVKYPKICGIKWWEVSKNKRYVVLLFKTNEYCGALQSSDEGKVFWAKLDELESMKLAENFDKILNVFTDDDVQEHIQLKNHGQWIDILK